MMQVDVPADTVAVPVGTVPEPHAALVLATVRARAARAPAGASGRSRHPGDLTAVPAGRKDQMASDSWAVRPSCPTVDRMNDWSHCPRSR